MRYGTVVKRAVAYLSFTTSTFSVMLVFIRRILRPLAVAVYVLGWSRLCYYEVGKAACFKRDFSISHGRSKVFYRVIILNVKYKVVIHVGVGYGNRNLYLAVRLYLYAIFRNVDIENIYATVFVVVLIGNCRKNFCCFFCGRHDLVAYQYRAFFKASTVNNDTVFVFERFKRADFLMARRKGTCKNSNQKKKYCC